MTDKEWALKQTKDSLEILAALTMKVHAYDFLDAEEKLDLYAAELFLKKVKEKLEK